MKLRTLGLLFAFCVTLGLLGCSKSQSKSNGQPGLEEAVSDATDIYVYGYPLVTMDMTRKFMTNYATVQASRGPMGQIIKLRSYPAADDHAVTAPTQTPSTRWLSLMSQMNHGSSAFRIWATATT